MSEISKLIIPGNTIPYDLRDDGAVRFDSAQNLTTAQKTQVRSNIGASEAEWIINMTKITSNDDVIYVLPNTNQQDIIQSNVPVLIHAHQDFAEIYMPVMNSANQGNVTCYYIEDSFIYILPFSEHGTDMWCEASAIETYDLSQIGVTNGIKIIEYTTAAATAYSQVETALANNQWPVVHWIEPDSGDNYEYWLPLCEYTTDEENYYFYCTLPESVYMNCCSVYLTSNAWGSVIYTTVPFTPAFYGICSTSANTVAKTANILNYKSYNNSIVVIKFTNSVPANATLNINSQGAKSIYYNGAAITAGIINAGDTATFIENSVYYYLLATDHGVVNEGQGQGYGTCSTAAATTAKTATLANYRLVKGGIVTIHFTYAVPANATLNINSQGAKSIYYKDVAITAGIIKAGNKATFIYDGSYYRLLTIDDTATKQGQIKTATLAGGAQNLSIAHLDDGTQQLTAGDLILFTFTNYTENFFQLTLTDKSMIYGVVTNGTMRRFEAGSTHLFYYDGSNLISISDDRITHAQQGQIYGTCSTAAATLAKTVINTNYRAADGGIVVIAFTEAVLANSTLSINSEPAHSIYYRGAAITDDVIRAGDIATFIYNSSHYNLLAVDHAARTTHDTTTTAGLGMYLGGNEMTLTGNNLKYHAYINGNIVNGWINVPSGANIPNGVSNIVPYFNIYCSNYYPNTELVGCPVGQIHVITDPSGTPKHSYSQLILKQVQPAGTPCIQVEAPQLSLRNSSGSAMAIAISIQFTYPYVESMTSSS